MARHWLTVYVAVIAVGSGLWAARDLRTSLWLDEAATASASTRSLPSLFHMLTNVDPALATYYLGMHAWTRVFGDSEVALRIPSLIAVVASIILLGAIGYRLAGILGGAMAASLLALWPHFIAVYGVEARNYALVVCLACASALCSLEIRDGRGGRLVVAAWSALAALTVAIDVLAAPAIVPQLVWLFWGQQSSRRRRLLPALIAPAAVGAIAVVLAHRGSFLETWIPGKGLKDYFVGAVALATIGGIALVLASLPGLRLFWKASTASIRNRAVLDFIAALCWAALPFLAIIGYSLLISPSFITRYYLSAAPGACLTVALCVTWSARGIRTTLAERSSGEQRRPLARVGLALLAIAAVITLVTPLALHDFSFATYEDPRATAAFIENHKKPGDGVVYAPTYAKLGIDWYLRPSHKDASSAPTDILGAPGQTAESAGLLWRPALATEQNPAILLKGRNRVWIVGYAGKITWRPGADAGSPLAYAIERCWVPGAKSENANPAFVYAQIWERPRTPKPHCSI